MEPFCYTDNGWICFRTGLVFYLFILFIACLSTGGERDMYAPRAQGFLFILIPAKYSASGTVAGTERVHTKYFLNEWMSLTFRS